MQVGHRPFPGRIGGQGSARGSLGALIRATAPLACSAAAATSSGNSANALSRPARRTSSSSIGLSMVGRFLPDQKVDAARGLVMTQFLANMEPLRCRRRSDQSLPRTLRGRIGLNGVQRHHPLLGLIDQLVYCADGLRVGHGSTQCPQPPDAVAYPFVLGHMRGLSHRAPTPNLASGSFGGQISN
jgi:hypothetical protein